MVKRDVDDVDPALRTPEAIWIAERWREAGKVLAVRSPELFAEMLALFEAWAVAAADSDPPPIDKVYFMT